MIVKNAKIYGKTLQDIELNGSKITQIGPNLQGSKSYDAKGLSLIPPFVDLKTKINHIDIKSLKELEERAIKAGFHTMVIRSKLDPAMLSVINELDFKIDFKFIAKAEDQNSKLCELSALIDAGAIGVELCSDSAHLFSVLSIMRLKRAWTFINIQDSLHDSFGVMNEGELSFKLGLNGKDARLELGQIARLNQLLKEDGHLVFENISLEKSLDLLAGKNALLCIHNLLKDENAVKDYDTNAKLEPVLREKKLALKSLLKLSLSPFEHFGFKKQLCFEEASFGTSCLDLYLGLLMQLRTKLCWEELSSLYALNPALLLGESFGKIEVGKEASFLLVDEDFSLLGDGLYENYPLKGKIKAHFHKGELLF